MLPFSISDHNTNRLPVLDPVGNKLVAEGNALTFTLSGSDPDNDALTYSASELPEGASFNPTTREFSWTPNFIQAGNYPGITFIVTDGSLSDSETITITVNNTNRAPVLDSIGNKPVAEGSALNFTLSGSDPDGDSLTYSASGLPSGANFNLTTRQFTWTPDFTQAGSYAGVTFAVTDGSLSDSEIITITVNNTPQAPVLNNIGNKSVLEGETLSFTITASDADNDALTYSDSSLPPGASFNPVTRQFSWTPNFSQAGSWPGVTFTVSDGSLSDSESITITVTNFNRDPDGTIISPATDKTIYAGQPVNFQGTGSDPDDDSLSFEWNFNGGAPNSAAQNPGRVTFNTPGVYTVTLTVTDSLGLADPVPDTRIITVKPLEPVVFVEPNGICGGNLPCLTSIQEAISIVALGGTIRVGQGLYRENLLVNTSNDFNLQGGWNADFTTPSTNPALTIIDGDLTADGVGEGSVIALEASSGEEIQLTINRFTIQNGNDQTGGGIFASAATGGQINLTLSGNIIRNNKSSNSGGGVTVSSQGSGSEIQAELINNMIYRNETTGDGGGIFAFSDNSGEVNLTLTNNTVTDNSAKGVGGGLRASANSGSETDVTATNNIIWGNSASSGHDVAIRQSLGGDATVQSSFNDIGDVFPDADAPGTYDDLGDNIDANPLFVDLSVGDLHLGVGSPAKNAGTDTGAPIEDFEGDGRPQGSYYDIGADEVPVASPGQGLDVRTDTFPAGEVGVGYGYGLEILCPFGKPELGHFFR